MCTGASNQRVVRQSVVSVFFAVATVLGCAVASSAETQNQPNILLILDASGSMWGQIEGKTKVEIAKQALTGIVKDLPDGAQVGLMLYGHRQKSDCRDVELVKALGPLDRQGLIAKINAINPKGMTPITLSIDKAVEAVRSAEGDTTIVLVSDGKETCEGDPCAAARRAKEAGIKLVIDVIGFDVSDEERTQLACIAEVTGGRYYPARNASELTLAAKMATTAEAEAPASGAGKVWFDPPAEVASGGELKVHFEAAPTFHARAWLGIIPSSVPHGSEEQNDQHDLTYEYIYKRTSGTITLRAPSEPGRYDVRLHDTDDNGREVASASFTVKAAEARIWIDRTDFVSSQPIDVHFASPTGLGDRAWVGIVPSNIPHGTSATNDENDISYSWVSGASGTVSLTGPGPAGHYDVRLHDSDGDGREIAYASFTVTQPTGKLTLARTSFAPGDEVQVHYQLGAALTGRAWAGIVPSDVPHGDEATNDENDVDYRYIEEGTTTGTVTLTAPDEPGSWDVRLNSGNANGVEVASVTFTVS